MNIEFLIVVIFVVVLETLVAIYFYRGKKRLQDLLQANGVEILELEKEKTRFRTEEQRIATQGAKSNAEEATKQNEIKRMCTIDQATKVIQGEIAKENTLKELLNVRAKNTAAEIRERKTKIAAGIDPDFAPPAPKTSLEKISGYLHKHWFLSFIVLIILIIILNKLHII